MEFKDVYGAKNVIVQIVWGEKIIEFATKAVDADNKGVYVEPYLFKGEPLDLTVNGKGGILCNLYCDDPMSGVRKNWKNIELQTIKKTDKVLYLLSTSVYNSRGVQCERRGAGRIKIRKTGSVWDEGQKKYVEVLINDVSDSGLSFYAPATYVPASGLIDVYLDDTVADKNFDFKLLCRIVYSRNKVGTKYYGCEIVEAPRDYLIYGCLNRAQTGKHEEHDSSLNSFMR